LPSRERLTSYFETVGEAFPPSFLYFDFLSLHSRGPRSLAPGQGTVLQVFSSDAFQPDVSQRSHGFLLLFLISIFSSLFFSTDTSPLFLRTAASASKSPAAQSTVTCPTGSVTVHSVPTISPPPAKLREKGFLGTSLSLRRISTQNNRGREPRPFFPFFSIA